MDLKLSYDQTRRWKGARYRGGCGPTQMGAPRDPTANRLRHCPGNIRSGAMKGVAIAARFTRRRGVICGKWAAPAGAVHLEFALDLTTKSLVSSACLKKSRYAANTQHSQDNLRWSVQNECEGIGGRNDTNKD
jgi:hypothetical protein